MTSLLRIKKNTTRTKITSLIKIVGLGIGLALLPIKLEAATQSDAIRVAMEPDHTRVVIESSTQIRFSLFSLRNPERALLDLEGVDAQINLDVLVQKIGSRHPYIFPLKISKLDKNKLRIEFRFKVDTDPRITVLKPGDNFGYRLVIDIYPELPATKTASTEATTAQTPKINELVKPSNIVTPAAITPTAKTAAETSPGASSTGSEKEITPQGAMEEMWLAVKINTEDSARNALILKRADGRLLVSKADLDLWRLRLPETAATVYEGEDYYPMDTLRGLSYELDAPSQTLLVQAAPGLYGSTNIQGTARGFVKPSASSLGAFLNYDVFVDQSKEQTNTSGLLELGVFANAGVGTSSFLGKNTNNSTNTTGKSIIRLDSTWTKDWPEQLVSLRMGDIINRPGAWGRSLRVGGVQWGTNFSTQPTLVTFPLPGLSGEAVLPSTVDLFVNDSLRLRKQLPTGPFSIQDLPVVTGMNEARLVTTDIFGRERVIVQPYYVSPRLLQKGLHDYSYEAGFIRQNYGLKSNDYGRFVAVGTHRLGITDQFTGEIHSELQADQQALGASGAWLMPNVGIFSGSLAASNGRSGQGGLFSFGFERTARKFGFGANTQITTNNFSQTGFQESQPPPRQLSQAFASWAAGKGSLGLSYTLQDYRDSPKVELLNGSYSTNFFGLGFLGISASKFLSGDKTTILGLTFTRALGDQVTASANVTAQAGSEVGSLQVQRSLPVGSGFGYRLSEGFGDSDRRAAGLFAQNDIGTYSLEAAQSMGETAYRASASGGLAILNQGIFMSRRINDSFALVYVPDFPGVRVYADNQVVANTDSKGRALIPRLRPYQKNAIRIEQADLPMDTQVESVELDLVPYFRSGVVAKFPVKQQQQGLIKVISEYGKPIPAGAVAYFIPENLEFPVGLEGEVFLAGLSAKNHIRIIWNQQSCDIEVAFTKSADPLPFLGTYTCLGIKL